MKTVEIIRLETSVEDGTFGTIRINKKILGDTLELPWRMNKPDISCIPAGQYLIKRRFSPRHGDTFTVQDVYGRTHINFHSATYVKQLLGCIALGESIKKLRNGRGLIHSGNTFQAFMQIMGRAQAGHLTIREEY